VESGETRVYELNLPVERAADGAVLCTLRAGDRVALSGTLLTARDAAHARLLAQLQKNSALPTESHDPPPASPFNAAPLPISLQNAAIYYCGPCPAPPGRPIGACGPTTADRMDFATPALLAAGVKVFVGKGPRGAEVVRAVKERGAVYLAAPGGAGALLAQCVTASRLAAYPDLGPEAVYALTIHDFPVIVALDSFGGDIYSRTR